MNLRPLRDDDFPAIHAAFLDAFGDYAVPFQISAPDLEEMIAAADTSRMRRSASSTPAASSPSPSTASANGMEHARDMTPAPAWFVRIADTD